MQPFLRKVKSTIHPQRQLQHQRQSQHHQNQHPNPSAASATTITSTTTSSAAATNQKSRLDAKAGPDSLADAPSPSSSHPHSHSNSHSSRLLSAAVFGRRLARTASTFSLRPRYRKSVPLPPTLESVPRHEPEKAILAPDVALKPTTESTTTLPTYLDLSQIDPEKSPAKQEHLRNQEDRMSTESAPPPVPFVRLKEIANEACATALAKATTYTHSETGSWNTTIINHILQSLIRETSASADQPPTYKFAVNSTIIQHAPAAPSSEGLKGGAASTSSGGGRRGMHSAAGAYWNNEKDGMWSFKYEAAEGKGLDVVVGVIWIWVG